MGGDLEYGNENAGDLEYEVVRLQVPKDLARAFHRCTWMIIHEGERDQLSVMEEVVRDFLIKNGC